MRPQVFTSEENEILIGHLRRLWAGGMSQTKIGRLLKVKQAHISAVFCGKSGLGRFSADALAQHMGYRDCFDLLEGRSMPRPRPPAPLKPVGKWRSFSRRP